MARVMYGPSSGRCTWRHVFCLRDLKMQFRKSKRIDLFKVHRPGRGGGGNS